MWRLFLFILFLAGPVSAADLLTMEELVGPTPGGERCFQRSYDAAHLKKHPDQKVTNLALYLDYRKFDGVTVPVYGFGIAVKRRGDPRTGMNGGTCFDMEKGVACHIDCDGGGMLLRKSRSGALLLDMTHNWGLALMSCGDDSVEMEAFVAGKDDKLFRLDPAPLEACAAARGE